MPPAIPEERGGDTKTGRWVSTKITTHKTRLLLKVPDLLFMPIEQ